MYKIRPRMIYGIGVNDADYEVQPRVDGRQLKCRYYTTWHSMMTRCYSKSYQRQFPTYIGCSVHKDWHSFMSFKSWMECQDWEGKHLDKDLLYVGNKVYASDKCVFVTPEVNTFIAGSKPKGNSKFPVGVHWHDRMGKYRAACSFRDYPEHLGYYDCVDEASRVYKAAKRKYIGILASEQADINVANAIIANFNLM